MVPQKAPKSRRELLVHTVVSRRKVVTRAAKRHLQQHRSLQHRWMRRFSNRLTERRIRAQWFRKVEAVAFHTRFASRQMGALGTLALCAAVPTTVPTLLATSPSTAIAHRHSAARPAQLAAANASTGATVVPAKTAIAGESAPQGASVSETAAAASAPAEAPTAPLSAPGVATDPSHDAAPAAALSLPQRAIEAVKTVVSPKTGVRVVADGREQRVSLSLPEKATVAQALQEMGIALAATDRTWPAVDTPATDGMSIRVTRVRVEVRTHRQSIPFETLFQPTSTIRPAARKTVQAGQTGIRETAERIWFVEGQVSSRATVSNRIAKAAKPQIVALGSRSAYLPGRIPYHNRYARAYALAARGGLGRERLQMQIPTTMKPLRAVRSMTLVATGYSPDPRENGGWTTTATGLPIGYGAAAVDPRVVPLGTKMYIEGYGYAFACDTGGAIKGNRIDLAYDSYRLANTKGRKSVKVWILQ